ncbi:MAG: helix-turn-helix domain-containing protein [Caldilineaceae bacterium]
MALYVRKLRDPEKRQIEQLIYEEEKDLPANRLLIVQLSAQGKRVPEISEEVDLHPINVRKWIHRFNESGLEGLRSGKSPGRPPLFTERQRRDILRVATSNPRHLGQQFSRWSLQRLRHYLIEEGIVEGISVETVRQIIQSNNILSAPNQKWF